MINYLKGIIVSKIENGPSGCSITVEVSNIGYLVFTNKRVIDSISDVGNSIKIYTSLIHREDAMSLCGFSTREDRDLFNILLSVSGVGTKVALLLLDELDAYKLVSAVIREDSKALSRTKGVGPKVAQRIILELKDKLINWREKIEPTPEHAGKFDTEKDKQSYLEAESVLLSLGYSKDETNKSLEKALSIVENKDDAEELLKNALKWLSNNSGC